MFKNFFKNASVYLLTLLVLILGINFVKLFSNTTPEPVKLIQSTALSKDEQSLDKKKYKLSPLKLNNRLVYIYGEITGDNGPVITQNILKLADSIEPMYILINSPGGSIIAGSKIVSAIEAARGPVVTVCVDMCASMAAMIHQYGTKRVVLNKGILMFHPASGGGGGGETDKMFSELTFIKRFIGKMEENAALRSKLDYKEYKFLSGTELWLDAEDSLAKNFTDEVSFVRGDDSDKLIHEEDLPPQEAGVINPIIEQFDIMWE